MRFSASPPCEFRSFGSVISIQHADGDSKINERIRLPVQRASVADAADMEASNMSGLCRPWVLPAKVASCHLRQGTSLRPSQPEDRTSGSQQGGLQRKKGPSTLLIWSCAWSHQNQVPVPALEVTGSHSSPGVLVSSIINQGCHQPSPAQLGG